MIGVLTLVLVVAIVLAPAQGAIAIALSGTFFLPPSGSIQPSVFLAAAAAVRVLVAQRALLSLEQAIVLAWTSLAGLLLGSATLLSLATGAGLFFDTFRLLDSVGQLVAFSGLAIAASFATRAAGPVAVATGIALAALVGGVVPGFVQFFTGQQLFTSDYFNFGRLTVPAQADPNFSAYFLVLSFPATFFLASERRRFVPAALLHFAAIALTFSRSGVLAVAAALVVMVAVGHGVRGRLALLIGKSTIVGLLLFVALRFSEAYEDISFLAETQSERLASTGNVSLRAELWGGFLSFAAQRNAAIGVGAVDYAAVGANTSGIGKSTHNLFVASTLETGILGLAWLVSLYALVSACALHCGGRYPWIVGMLTADVLMVNTLGYQPLWGLALVSGIAGALFFESARRQR